MTKKVVDSIVNTSLIATIYLINKPDHWWQMLIESLLLITFGVYNWFHGYEEWVVSDEQ